MADNVSLGQNLGGLPGGAKIVGPPKDEAEFQQRKSSIHAFLIKPEVQAALLQFAQGVLQPRPEGTSSGSQIVQAAGQGLEAAGRVTTNREKREDVVADRDLKGRDVAVREGQLELNRNVAKDKDFLSKARLKIEKEDQKLRARGVTAQERANQLNAQLRRDGVKIAQRKLILAELGLEHKIEHDSATLELDKANLGIKRQALREKAERGEADAPVETILDEEGKPKIVRRSDAVGETPAPTERKPTTIEERTTNLKKILTDRNVPEDTAQELASMVANGGYEFSHDPQSNALTITNKLTKEQVPVITAGQVNPLFDTGIEDEGGEETFTISPSVSPPSQVLNDPVPDVGDATGLKGLATSIVNTITDTLGAGLVDRNNVEAEALMKNLKSATSMMLLAAMPGKRLTDTLRKDLAELVPTANSIWEGEETALIGLTAMRTRIFKERLRLQTTIINKRGKFKPKVYQDAVVSAAQLDGLLDTYNQIIDGFDKTPAKISNMSCAQLAVLIDDVGSLGKNAKSAAHNRWINEDCALP